MADLFSAPGADLPEFKGDEGVKRNQWGQYLLPHPESGREMAFIRATTFAKSAADTFALNLWKQRMTAIGMAIRPDLVAAVAALVPEDMEKLDKKEVNKLAEQATEAAGAKQAATLGTALHAFSERVDAGETPFIPPPWDKDVEVYQAAMEQSGYLVHSDYIEKQIVVMKHRVAGTFDRILQRPDGTWRIGDLKTGKDLSYGWGEIAVQLALYANADFIWNRFTGEYEPMPQPLDKKIGVVVHLPVGKNVATIYEVDLEAGWEAAQLCADTRTWRGRKDLAVMAQAPVRYADLQPAESKPKGTPASRAAAAKKAAAAAVATMPSSRSTAVQKAVDVAVSAPAAAAVPAKSEGPKWAQLITAATTRGELAKIWELATAAKEWTPLLEKQGKVRMAELNGGTS